MKPACQSREDSILPSIVYGLGRGRPVLPAAQRGASCPVDHPCRGPLLYGHTRARHGHCRIDRQDLVKPSHHLRIQLFHQFFTDTMYVSASSSSYQGVHPAMPARMPPTLWPAMSIRQPLALL
eukprot:1192829-Prorocentrum_minimum.AAC.3